MILALLIGLLSFEQSPRDPGCREWHECRAMAIEAADRGDYEIFHDLAWRAVQTGPPRDPALMSLLARAQALSGRPHDALVMLDRLADMGIGSDADTNDDFVRTRQLPGWPEVAAKIARLRGTPAPAPASPPRAAPRPAAAPPAVAPPAAPPPAAAPPAAAPPPAPVAVPTPEVAAPAAAAPMPTPRSEAVRFSTPRLTAVGLAYDSVSRRIVVGDRLARKLVVVSEGSHQPLDLVRAESAGFHDIAALAIDDRRGDLWVASTDSDGTGMLHRLQLVSGRPLKTYPIAAGAAPLAIVDLAVTRGGTVLALDAAGGRIFAMHPGGASIETAMHIDLPAPASITVGADEALAYIAYRDGISRIDLRARTTTRVRAGKEMSLAQLQRIRWHRNGLLGVAANEGSSRIVRFDLDAGGKTVRRATVVDAQVAIVDPSCVAVAGDDLLYLAPAADHDFVAYRIPIH